VLGDQQRLQQIAWNLLSNAVKFTDPGGVVHVRVMPSGKMTRLEVADTGHGISAEFLPYVFDRFRQSDSSSARRHGGLGLGLALVRELVELHGGSVRADSAGDQQGSTFTIDLPTAMSPDVRENHVARTDAPADPPSLADLRVLVVEDEADSRDLLVETLTRCGAEAIAVSSCDEALAILRQMAVTRTLPHVILSDLGMPRDDGFALIRRIRSLQAEEGGGIPAVAVTGYANPDDRQRALAAGFQGHLAKPIDPVTVAHAVRRAFGS
jgi:CheY-like chemotaxis protein